MNELTGQIDEPDIWCGERKKKATRFLHCELCGEKIERAHMAFHQRTCQHKCTPMEGLIIHCSNCGQPKGYDEYYDYRDAALGRFLWECKQCKRDKNRGPSLKRYHKNKKCKECGEVGFHKMDCEKGAER